LKKILKKKKSKKGVAKVEADLKKSKIDTNKNKIDHFKKRMPINTKKKTKNCLIINRIKINKFTLKTII